MNFFVQIFFFKGKIILLIQTCNKSIYLMGFEIIGVQAQDASPNVEIKNGPSTSNRPLMVSLKCRPKTRVQLAHLKDW